MKLRVLITYIIIVLLILNMILFALKKISMTLFWFIILIFGLVSYFGYKKKNMP